MGLLAYILVTPVAGRANSTTSDVNKSTSTASVSVLSGTEELKRAISEGKADIQYLRNGTSTRYGLSHSLHHGSNGKEVIILQNFLKIYGALAKGAPTGHFGPLTKHAVEVFQQKESLDVVGRVGTKTRARIIAISGRTLDYPTTQGASSSPMIINAILSTDVGDDGSGVGEATVFSSTTHNIYAILTLTDVVQSTEIAYVRSFNSKYVDSGVTHPSRARLHYMHFQWSTKLGAIRPVGAYSLTFYINGKRAKSVAFSVQ